MSADMRIITHIMLKSFRTKQKKMKHQCITLKLLDLAPSPSASRIVCFGLIIIKNEKGPLEGTK
jgi:hypothetical protein